MDLTDEHKKDVERQITDTLITALEQNKITEDEGRDIATHILDRIDAVKSHHDLVIFLRELTEKWNMFSFVLTLEDGKVKKIEENKSIEKVQQLTQAGNIEQAIEEAKKATSSPVT